MRTHEQQYTTACRVLQLSPIEAKQNKVSLNDLQEEINKKTECTCITNHFYEHMNTQDINNICTMCHKERK